MLLSLSPADDVFGPLPRLTLTCTPSVDTLRPSRLLPALAAAMMVFAASVSAQNAPPSSAPSMTDAASAQTANRGPLTLSLEEAVQIALVQNYAVRSAELDVANARAQVREAYGALMPTVSATSSYTRNVVQANPFAGSSAGTIFGSLGSVDWLAYNETARTDDDPETEPLPLMEFRQRQQAAQEEAGVLLGDGNDNPFGVANQFQNQLSITQPLYNGSAFAAVRGAKSLVDVNRAALQQRRHETIDQTRRLFYNALLAEERLRVLTASSNRAQQTLNDATLQVAQGVRPKLDELNAEVDLANARAQVVQARAQAEGARDQLLLTLGLPTDREIRLRGDLQAPEESLFRTVGLSVASARAFDQRPDIQQARLAVDLNEVQRDITRAAAYPSLSLFANLGYSGSVPDDRTFATQTGPFEFETGENDFLSDAYWQPSVAVGARLSWTLFDGFATRYQVQQNTVAVEKARIQLEQAEQAARVEVAGAIRNLNSAQERLQALSQNVEAAETAFQYASERLAVGVASQVDVRLASNNLDQARLNYLQAAYDALVARSAYERATGTIAPAALTPDPPPATSTASR